MGMLVVIAGCILLITAFVGHTVFSFAFNPQLGKIFTGVDSCGWGTTWSQGDTDKFMFHIQEAMPVTYPQALESLLRWGVPPPTSDGRRNISALLQKDSEKYARRMHSRSGADRKGAVKRLYFFPVL